VRVYVYVLRSLMTDWYGTLRRGGTHNNSHRFLRNIPERPQLWEKDALFFFFLLPSLLG
jgi:hypothetical protein